MKLISRSGDTKLSSIGEIKLSSNSISFNGSKLYITRGIQFFDSEPKDFDLSSPFEAYDLITSGDQLMASSG